MPSKKKSHHRGKARKGANNKKVEEKKKEAETPDVQMQRLKIGGDDFQADEDAALEEAIKVAAAQKEALDAANAENEKAITKKATNLIIRADQCRHGYFVTDEHVIVEDFANTFVAGYSSVAAGAIIGDAFRTANKATEEKYPDWWFDSSKMKQVISSLLFQGTHYVLEGNMTDARHYASFACYFAALRLQAKAIRVSFTTTKTIIDMTKVVELQLADEHTLVKYLRKSIPCNCLDKQYTQVQSITKMGICANALCCLPDRMVERSKMLYCTQCRSVNYCSSTCQKAHWLTHKKFCDKMISSKGKGES